jgi:hypothetical protein
MSSNLSIEQIVLINNLLYCEKFGEPKTDFLSSSNECKSVGQYVERVLANIHFVDDKEYRTGMLGYEFKEIFNAVNCDERLKSLVIREIHIEDAEAGGGRSVYLYDPEAKEAIVAFKGTESDAEWVDNVTGLYKVPTDFQRNALAWFQSLSFDDCDTITVTGHSKGGNKAKFITIMDEKVDDCYAYDGQGFSDGFIRKYSNEIIQNSAKIHNINEESDFVNILLNDVGEKQFYLGTNFGRLGFAENHCSNAILFFDDDGKAFVWKADGQDKKMADLDEMLNSFIRACLMTTRVQVADMLGNVIKNAFKGDTDGLADVFCDERYSDSAAKLISYVLRYKTQNPQMAKNIKTILLQNGFSSSMIDAINFITGSDIIMELIGKNKGAMISLLKSNHAPANVIAFLNKHEGLFDFIVLVSKYMRIESPLRFSGKDLQPGQSVWSLRDTSTKSNSKNRLVIIAVAAGALAVVLGTIAAVRALFVKKS